MLVYIMHFVLQNSYSILAYFLPPSYPMQSVSWTQIQTVLYHVLFNSVLHVLIHTKKFMLGKFNKSSIQFYKNIYWPHSIMYVLTPM